MKYEFNNNAIRDLLLLNDWTKYKAAHIIGTSHSLISSWVEDASKMNTKHRLMVLNNTNADLGLFYVESDVCIHDKEKS
jgi:hypothetical protein